MVRRSNPDYWAAVHKEIPPPKVIITGVGHSGTGYIASVLAHIPGVLVRHEGYYNPFETRATNLDVDSSWIAVAALDVYEGTVFHQVREPLKTVTSLAFTGAWHGAYYYMRKDLVRPMTGDRLVDAMALYVDLNQKAEDRADGWWQVEHVNEGIVGTILDAIGKPTEPDIIHEAIDDVSIRTNAHYKAHALEWDQLPDHPVKEELREMGKRYGY